MALEDEAAELKIFSKKAIERGWGDFVVDLNKCTEMDDVFMGTLAGLALRLRELRRGRVTLSKTPTQIARQLKDLGLEQLFEM